MIANPDFVGQDLEFWANIKLLNQRLGYTQRVSKKNPIPGFIIPTVTQIKDVFNDEGLDSSKLISGSSLSTYGQFIVAYMRFRGGVLTNHVEPNLLNKDQAKYLFYDLKNKLNPSCPLPMNKQSGDKKDFAFLTGIVNMLIEQNKGNLDCDYDPKELTAITNHKFPIRTLSRRVDGAFPSPIDPIAIWEIKEYYYTTTFGSRVADGVYETQLDGWELSEVKKSTGRIVQHYLIIDDYFTWWTLGRSYLCRIIDTLHMGLVSEVLFGREVITRLPQIVQGWTNPYQISNEDNSRKIAAESDPD